MLPFTSAMTQNKNNNEWASTTTTNTPPKAPPSPFFAPSTPNIAVTEQTPGGTRRKIKKPKQGGDLTEHKTNILGCSANLVNAIVGSGIVGVPYAMKQSGFLAGVFLILLCAVLTEKSLRLLVATAKHVRCPSYETAAEAAYGTMGFRFVALNMLILSYGAMLSYLMIVKDSFSSIFGVDYDDKPLRRAILLFISMAVMVPLASKRDMADLAFTSRISVVIDILLVILVVYEAPVVKSFESIGEWQGLAHRTVHWDTIFVGLGVLSFAFVCQHSAFIIAGSMEKPTNQRWSIVTRVALFLAGTLALICGVSGYLGFLDDTAGNILENLNASSWKATAARSMLGVTMLFVYPLESFVARHVCVVLLFSGRRAHEGDDTTILHRRDRRIGLTVVLYIVAVVPAAAFEELGPVLAVTGAIGGSCLSYIGPGLIFLGVHGARFLELVRSSWLGSCLVVTSKTNNNQNNSKTVQQQYPNEPSSTNSRQNERTPLVPTKLPTTSNTTVTTVRRDTDSASSSNGQPFIIGCFKWLFWYLLGMPIWCFLAQAGKTGLEQHSHEMALKSPHPIRIGDVKQRTQSESAMESPSATAQSPADHRMTIAPSPSNNNANTAYRIVGPGNIIRHNSFTSSSTVKTTPTMGLPPPPSSPGSSVLWKPLNSSTTGPSSTITPNSSSNNIGINEMLGKELVQKRKLKEHQSAMAALEQDPQDSPATWYDFFIAIFYILFGMLALIAGVVSLLQQPDADSTTTIVNVPAA